MYDLKKVEKQLFLVPNYLGVKHPEAWLPNYFAHLLTDMSLLFCESYKSAELLMDRQNLPEMVLFEINEHSQWEKIEPEIMLLLQTHHKIGVLSDAGMPCIADPGERVVALAHLLNIPVYPLPGPNSMILALAASGFNGERFSFLGYAPIHLKELENWLTQVCLDIKKNNNSAIFMETPYRNTKLLSFLFNRVSDKISLCVAVNLLTKDSFVVSKTIKEWKLLVQNGMDLEALFHKKPTVFVLGNPL